MQCKLRRGSGKGHAGERSSHLGDKRGRSGLVSLKDGSGEGTESSASPPGSEGGMGGDAELSVPP